MPKMQNDVESFIRHLQSSLDKRKQEINIAREDYECALKMLAQFKVSKNAGVYSKHMEWGESVSRGDVKEAKRLLKYLHEQQKRETDMLKYFECERSKQLLEI